MKQVTLANGETRLWKPDLKPYEHPEALPAALKPNELGLLHHDGQAFLVLGDKHYRVKIDPVSGQYRIVHPARANAYAPELNHNGFGAWRHEVEQPRTWEVRELMRRIGHGVREFSDAELEQIRHVSGTDEGLASNARRERATGTDVGRYDDSICRVQAGRGIYHRHAERLIQHFCNRSLDQSAACHDAVRRVAGDGIDTDY